MTTQKLLPEHGIDREEIFSRMREFAGEDANYRDGRTWSLVYYLGEEYNQLLKDAYGMFFSENGLNPMAFKSLKRFEAEVIRMAADLLNGDRNVVGTMTSGGTESCLLAVKTCRDMALSKKRWLKKPEMIVPETVHVAFEKAAEYFGLKIVHAPLDKDFRVNVKAVRRRINRHTAMIVGSAPQYPHGIIDPIEDLGKLAKRKGIPLHVDSCVGGFLLPFVEKLGYDIPPFDFRVPGVTSMSADVHKYGYAAKGASTILYRDMDIMKHQFFVYTNWCGGIYASPALLGTRPGGAIAAAWAALQYNGMDGYMSRARSLMATTRKLIDGINAIDGLQVIGKPAMSVFAYRSTTPDLSIYAVGDQMEEKGWHIDRQQKPECLHAMVTPNHSEVAEQYLSDLKEAVDYVRRNPDLADKGSAAMYGMIANIPMRQMIKSNVLKMFTEMYGPDGQSIDLSADDNDDLATKAGMLFIKLKRKLSKR